MILLDLFCGGGGAAEGYHRAGWEVVGVDIDPQPCYPYRFVQADAMERLDFLIEAFQPKAIHASPPCQPYSRAVTSISSPWNDTRGKDEPALIPRLRSLLIASGKPYVIENVTGAREWLRDPIKLCGSMFDLDIPRHRLFESNVKLQQPVHWNCYGMAKRAAARRGWDYRDMTVTGKGRRAGWGDRARELLGITHPMRQHDLKEAIPPLYTQWIGLQLMALFLRHQQELRSAEVEAL